MMYSMSETGNTLEVEQPELEKNRWLTVGLVDLVVALLDELR